jgi:5'-3' exonuclease
MTSKKRLLLVDAPSYLYRAFHALPEFRSPAGEPTGAIMGVVNMLRKLKQDFPSDYIAAVFDPKGKTFRDDIYPEYKATRQAMPEPLAQQVEPLLETIAAMGWPIVTIDGVEADDVIGTLVRIAETRGMDSVISTGDKDLTQLVNEHVLWVNTMSGDKLDPAGVKGKFGVPPELIVDYLALMGDAVDNVPGVDKVGPKTACKLIEQYGSLEGVIAHKDEIKGVVGENLRRVADWLPTGRRLLTVKTDVELSFDLESLRDKGADTKKLVELFGRFGFRTLRDSLINKEDAPEGGAARPEPPPPSEKGRNFALLNFNVDQVADITPFVDTRKYETVLDDAALDRWIAKLEAAPIATLDTETTSLDPMAADLVGISVSAAPGEGAYIPLTHRYAGAPPQLATPHVIEKMRRWLEDPKKLKVGQNAKYDRHVFANQGVDVQGVVHDTLLQSYVLQSHQRHDMDALATRFLGATGLLQYADVAGKGAAMIPFDQVDIERATAYSAEDADVTLQLHGALFPRVAKDEKLNRIYSAIEIPVAGVLLTMERNGVLIDTQMLVRQGTEIGQKMLELEKRAHEAAGGPVQPGVAETALRHPLRAPQAEGGEEDPFGLALGGRGSAGEAGRGPSALQDPPRAPGPVEAEEHLHRQAAEDGPPEDRARSHELRAGGGGHGPALVERAEPAEHPGAHRRGSPHPRGVRGARRLEDRLRRLFADRAAHHGAPFGRQEPARRFLPGRGRAPPHRGGSVRYAARPGDERAAPLREGHQLRPHLRHERLRPCAEPRHRARGRGQLHGEILHALPERGRIHGAHAQRGARARLRGDGVRPPALASRHPLLQHGAPPGRGAPGHQRPHAGHRRRPHQGRHDRRAGSGSRRRSSPPSS